VDNHLLSIVALVPVVGVLALLAVGRSTDLRDQTGREWRDRLLPMIAGAATAITFAASLPLWFGFEVRGAEWQFTERLDVMPSIGASYAVGIDGLSLLLILLTTFLSFIAVLASWATVTSRVKEHYIGVLVLEAGMLGVYMALDLLLFSLFWMLAAAAMCFLIEAAGGRPRAGLRISVIAILPGLVILLGMIALSIAGHSITGARTFDLRMFQHLALPTALQRWVFLAFFAGFGAGLLGVFRWWLTVAADGRAVALPVLLAAVFLKMGSYGFLRLSLPLLPDASRVFAPWVVALSAIGIVCGAVAAFRQTNWTGVLAYASLSHLCLVVLGAFALTPDGLTGSAVHQVNHGVSIAALFLLVGLVVARDDERNTRGQVAAIAEYGGLLNAMPLVAAVWMLMTLSLVGVPKLNGFVGTRLIIEGIWPVSRVWSVVAVSGLILSGAALFWLFSRTMLGELRSPAGVLKDLRLREAVVFAPLVVFAVWAGLSPAPLLARVETSVARVVMRVSPQYAPEVADCLSQPAPPPTDSGLPAGMVLAAPCADGTGSPTAPHR
jgi:NADH-quinone oxidoreductase subunit M